MPQRAPPAWHSDMQLPGKLLLSATALLLLSLAFRFYRNRSQPGGKIPPGEQREERDGDGDEGGDGSEGLRRRRGRVGEEGRGDTPGNGPGMRHEELRGERSSPRGQEEGEGEEMGSGSGLIPGKAPLGPAGRESEVGSEPERKLGWKLGVKPERKAGIELGGDPGRKMGSELGNQPGSEVGMGPGNKSGSKSGSRLGIKSGNNPGSKLGTEVGNEWGSEPGTKLRNKLGSKLGIKSGSKPGIELGIDPGSKPGSELGSEPGILPGNELGILPGILPGCHAPGAAAGSRSCPEEKDALRPSSGSSAGILAARTAGDGCAQSTDTEPAGRGGSGEAEGRRGTVQTLSVTSSLGLLLRASAAGSDSAYSFSSVAKIQVEENFIRERRDRDRDSDRDSDSPRGPGLRGKVYDYFVQSVSEAVSKRTALPFIPAGTSRSGAERGQGEPRSSGTQNPALEIPDPDTSRAAPPPARGWDSPPEPPFPGVAGSPQISLPTESAGPDPSRVPPPAPAAGSDPSQVPPAETAMGPDPPRVSPSTSVPDPDPSRVSPSTSVPDPDPSRVSPLTSVPDPDPSRVSPPAPVPDPDPFQVSPPAPVPDPDPSRVSPAAPVPDPDPSRVSPPAPVPDPDPTPPAEVHLGNCYEVLRSAKARQLRAQQDAALQVMSDHYLQVLRSPDIYGRLNAGERELLLRRRTRGRPRLVVADVPPAEPGHHRGRLCYYDEDGDRWCHLSHIPAEVAWRGCAMCSMFNYLFVAAGWEGAAGQPSPSRRVLCYDPVADTWSDICPLRQARPRCRLVALDGHLYAIGGECLATVERYDPRRDRWTPASPLPGDTFAVAHAAAACAGDIYVTGGTLRSLLLRYDARGDSWTAGPALGDEDGTAELVSAHGFLYRFQLRRGAAGAADVTVSRCSASARLWYRCASRPLPDPAGLRCAALGGLVHCLGRGFHLRFLADPVSPRFGSRELRPFPAPHGSLLPAVLVLPEGRAEPPRL